MSKPHPNAVPALEIPQASPAMLVMMGSLLFGAEQAYAANSPEFYHLKAAEVPKQ